MCSAGPVPCSGIGTRLGTVGLRDFDQGIVETLGAFEQDDAYWLNVPGVTPPPELPGVPVSFSFPEDVYKTYKLPMLLVKRDEVTPAVNRIHPGAHQYRCAAVGTTNAVVGGQIGPREVEMMVQAAPFDITYTLSVLAHYRGGIQLRGQVNALFTAVLRVYQTYADMRVKDSLGRIRQYSCFTEGTTVLDEVAEVAERVLGFGVTVRVEAELDLNDAYTARTVTQPLTSRFHVK